MKNNFSSYLRIFMLLMLSLVLNVFAESVTPLNTSSVTLLSNHVPSKAIANAAFLNNLSSDEQVSLTFVLPLRNEEKLKAQLHRIYNPHDHEHYGKYLTTQEFIEKFAPTQEDYDNLIAYAKGIGLQITGTHANRILLNVAGQTESIEAAFNLNLYQYQLPSGRKFHAPNKDPEVPTHVANIISGIVGLSNHAVWRSFNRLKEIVEERAEIFDAASPSSSPSGPGGGYAPQDLLTAYNLGGLSTKGSGQNIALFELASYQASDINTYTNYFHLPTAQLHNVLVDGGSNSGINAEVTLDIQLAIALAPSSQIYVYEGPNSSQGVLDTYNRIATDNIAKQVSTSWGLGEDEESSQFLQAENSIFMQMAAHGQTIYAASGDSGAYDDYWNGGSTALVVNDPASQPYVVGVGGTRLAVNSTTGAYTSEVVWNNGLGNGASGGGVSTIWTIPSWQQNIPTVYSTSHRNVPDISLNADPSTGYAIYHAGQWAIYGGTSCAAPLWAAFTACVNQQLAATQQSPLGFANPALYALANGSSYSTDFHDITSGNNYYYQAHPSYDNACGWGSFNGSNLFSSLTNSSPTPPPPPSCIQPILSINMAHSGNFTKGTTGTYRIDISNFGNGSTSGPVTVQVNLPSGLQYQSFSGSGWVFNSQTSTFTNNNVLAPGLGYPTLSVNVLVSSSAPCVVAPIGTVSGGGSVTNVMSNPTTIK
jgi:uncharacterized repeat protein (TIGR01451 family)